MDHNVPAPDQRPRWLFLREKENTSACKQEPIPVFFDAVIEWHRLGLFFLNLVRGIEEFY